MSVLLRCEAAEREGVTPTSPIIRTTSDTSIAKYKLTRKKHDELFRGGSTWYGSLQDEDNIVTC